MKSACVNIQLVYQDSVVSAATGFKRAYDIACHVYGATVETLKRHLRRTQRRTWRQARKRTA